MNRIFAAVILCAISFSTWASDNNWPVSGFDQMLTDSQSSVDNSKMAAATSGYVEPIPGFAQMMANQDRNSRQASNVAQGNNLVAHRQD